MLCSQVPKRPDAPAMADGNQVQVIELWRPGASQAQQVTGPGEDTNPRVPQGSIQQAPRPAEPALAKLRGPPQDRSPDHTGTHVPRVRERGRPKEWNFCLFLLLKNTRGGCFWTHRDDRVPARAKASSFPSRVYGLIAFTQATTVRHKAIKVHTGGRRLSERAIQRGFLVEKAEDLGLEDVGLE